MKKQKTQKELELEDDIKAWKWLVLGLLIITIFLFGIGISGVYDNSKLETKLSECQEQVKVWTLKVEYNIYGGNDKWQRSLKEFIIMETVNYTDYEDYTFFRNKCRKNENCEVIK